VPNPEARVEKTKAAIAKANPIRPTVNTIETIATLLSTIDRPTAVQPCTAQWAAKNRRMDTYKIGSITSLAVLTEKPFSEEDLPCHNTPHFSK